MRLNVTYLHFVNDVASMATQKMFVRVPDFAIIVKIITT